MTDNEIVARIQELTRLHNPCNIRKEADKNVCNGGEPCCTGCKHLSKTGCTVSAHGCRMWFCETAWALLPLSVMIEMYKLIDQYKGRLYFRHDQGAMPKTNLLWPIESRASKKLFTQALKSHE